MKKHTRKVMFSSDSTEWETPPELFKVWDDRYHFTLDVCASLNNAKCGEFFTKECDGLSQSWEGEVCWMNPPYGRAIPAWVRKAWEERHNGVTTVALLPSRTDVKWFHQWVHKVPGVEVHFLKGRVKFVGAKSCAPFPSMIVVFNAVKQEKTGIKL